MHDTQRRIGGSFAVACMACESRSVLDAFINYYDWAGAAEIFLFIDEGCEAPGVTIGRHGARIEVIHLDSSFWLATGEGDVPEGLEVAQGRVYSWAFGRAASEWLLVVDADEFVFGGAIRDMLSSVPEHIRSFRLPTAEAVYGPGDGVDDRFGSRYFRVAWAEHKTALGQRVYGEIYDLMACGLVGHRAGKAFTRVTGDLLEFRPHSVFENGRRVTVWSPETDLAQGFYLGHFDAISFDRWPEKWLRRIRGQTNALNMGQHRRKQMEVIQNAADHGEARMRKLYRDLYSLNVLQYGVLKVAGKAFRSNVVASVLGGYDRSARC